jgi:hypothetical protein
MRKQKKPSPKLTFEDQDEFPGCCGIQVPNGLELEEPEPDDRDENNEATSWQFYGQDLLPEGKKIQLCTTIPSQKLDNAMRAAGFTAVIDFPSDHAARVNESYRITLWVRGKNIRYLMANSPTFSAVSKRLSK